MQKTRKELRRINDASLSSLDNKAICVAEGRGCCYENDGVVDDRAFPRSGADPLWGMGFFLLRIQMQIASM